MLPSNGEAEGPDDHASQRPRARNIDWAPRPQTTHASRTPPTIVRRTERHTNLLPLFPAALGIDVLVTARLSHLCSYIARERNSCAAIANGKDLLFR